MKNQYRRPSPLECAKEYARELMDEVLKHRDTRPLSYDSARDRLHAVHIIAIRVGWKSLDQEIVQFIDSLTTTPEASK